MNVEKLIQAVAYLLKKYEHRLNYTKLIKLLYLADKESLRECNQTITGDTYVCMKNGPVLSGLYNLIKGQSGNRDTQCLWNSKFSRDGNDLVALVDRIPDGKLSRFEKTALDKINTQFQSASFGTMIDYVHDRANCPEWKDPGHSSSRLEMKDLLASIGRSPEEINWILDEQKMFEKEDRILNKLEQTENG
jgi:uncharacterized phage-associated protein